MSIKDDVRAFFASYIDAFARNDADALSVSWDEVGLFPSPTGGQPPLKWSALWYGF